MTRQRICSLVAIDRVLRSDQVRASRTDRLSAALHMSGTYFPRFLILANVSAYSAIDSNVTDAPSTAIRPTTSGGLARS